MTQHIQRIHDAYNEKGWMRLMEGLRLIDLANGHARTEMERLEAIRLTKKLLSRIDAD